MIFARPSFDKQRYLWFGAILLSLILLLIYFPALHGDFIMDDDIHLSKDNYITDDQGLFKIWFEHKKDGWGYWPFSRSMFWLEYRIWGFQTLGFHLINILLHACCTCVLFVIIRRYLPALALWISLLYALHPIQVESVAWITQQKGLWATLWGLICFLCWLNYLQNLRRWKTLLAYVFFALALLSKSSVVTLPLLITFFSLFNPTENQNNQKKLSTKQVLIVTLPFYILALLKAWLEVYSSFSHSMTFSFTFLERLLLASQTSWLYFFKMLWPTPLSFIYPTWKVEPKDPSQWLGLLSGLFLIGSLLWGYFHNGLKRLSQSHKVQCNFVFICLFTFLLFIFPISGFIGFGGLQYAFYADHWGQLALIPWLIFMVLVCHSVFKNKIERKKSNSKLPFTTLLFLGMAFLYGILSWQQAHLYKGPVSLYTDTINKFPQAWIAHYNLGVYWLDRQDNELALSFFNTTLQINPNYVMALNNRGTISTTQGRLAEAEEDFNRALQLSPGHVKALVNRGRVFLIQKKFELALTDLNLALQFDPQLTQAYNNRAAAHAYQGQLELALEDFQMALKLDPKYADAHANQGAILSQLGRTQEAITSLRTALQFAPNHLNALQRLSKLLSEKKLWTEVCPLLNRLCALGSCESLQNAKAENDC